MATEIVSKLRQMAQSKNDTFAIIAQTLLNCSNYASLNIKKLHEDCHVSNTTVFRFCKSLGVSGFSELKFLLCQTEEQHKKLRIRDNYALSKNANEHLNNIAISFIETRDLLTDEMLDKVVDMLSRAQRVSIFAGGSTFLVARDLELKLDRVKVFAKAYEDENLQYFAAKNAEPNTLAVGITYSGKTERILNCLRICKQQGAHTILLTSQENVRFQNEFDQVLYIHSNEPRNRLITTTARLTMLYLIDLIYYSYINKNIDLSNSILEHNKLYDLL